MSFLILSILKARIQPKNSFQPYPSALRDSPLIVYMFYFPFSFLFTFFHINEPLAPTF